MAKGKGIINGPIPIDFVSRMNVRFGEERTHALMEALHKEPSVSVQRNPIKPSDRFIGNQSVPWYSYGRVLQTRPSFTLDPLYHAGGYYSQESSSMFLAHAWSKLDLGENQDLRILDLCAAPGGKSLLLSHFIEDRGVLFCNEINKLRNAVLMENMIKSGRTNYVVTSANADAWGQMSGYFDVILVDAPCSGEGMFRKDMQARADWSLDNVAMCATRQRSILENIVPALKPGGYLIYSTCTFAESENEEILKFLQAEYGFESLDLQPPVEWNLDEVQVDGMHGYRFWPDRIAGEGLFMAVLRAPADQEVFHRFKPKNFFYMADKRAMPVVRSVVDVHQAIMDSRGVCYHSPLALEELNQWAHYVYFTALGCALGEVKHTDFIPNAALALVVGLEVHAERIELSTDEALAFLRGDTLVLPAGQGLARVDHLELGLGWVKRMGMRSNNYYPKEWRIRMR